VMEETIFAKGRPFLPRVSEMRNPPPGESPVSGLARVNSIGPRLWEGRFRATYTMLYQPRPQANMGAGTGETE